jgi:hypothetical protein
MTDMRNELINLIEMMGLNEENAAKAIACFEAHIENRVLEEVESIRESVMGDLMAKIDEYLGEHVTDSIEEAESEIEELKRMMVIALTGGPESRAELLRKIGALARKNAVSASADSDWGAESPDASAANRASISPHHEDYEDHGPMANYMRAIDRHVRK